VLTLSVFSKGRAGRRGRFAAAGSLLAALSLSLVTAAPASAAERAVDVRYKSGEWEVIFEGTVEATGFTSYRFEGYLYAYCPPGRFPAPQIALGYGPEWDAWQYKTVSCARTTFVSGSGRRPSVDRVEFKVGANSGALGAWDYGPSKLYDIGS
jgi:hypothetical protein